MMHASSRATANSVALVRPAYLLRPAITPPASVKLPNSGLPAYSAAQKDIIATPPIITKTIPIHRSAFSYFMKRGVMRFDYIALLEKQLPRCNGGADNTDHEQHHVAQLRVRRPGRHEEVACDLRHGRVDRHQHRNKQQA